MNKLFSLPFTCCAGDQYDHHFTIKISFVVHLCIDLHIDSNLNQKINFTAIVVGLKAITTPIFLF